MKIIIDNDTDIVFVDRNGTKVAELNAHIDDFGDMSFYATTFGDGTEGEIGQCIEDCIHVHNFVDDECTGADCYATTRKPCADCKVMHDHDCPLIN